MKPYRLVEAGGDNALLPILDRRSRGHILLRRDTGSDAALLQGAVSARFDPHRDLHPLPACR